MPNEVLLDVSELAPPEPLTLTLEAAEQLQAGQYLRMLHRREPCMLFGNLDDNHFKYFQRKGAISAVEVFIWAEDDKEAAEAVQAIIDAQD
ncbi:MAG: DUF2249 domain-containing protein [Gammaproteobacteria bacterium]|nr:DUF2249 domain-containing protein [Gammaproteobacteria bacterium]MCK5263297.1 DUF2249 domain-containing protein [Gammaproteobacteria bacterium]